MRVETIHRYAAKLPSPDFHPYRTDAWTPNDVEVDAFDLEVVEGPIPADLDGVYLRNTENPLFEAIGGRYHPFDGDGMLHAIHFRDGGADYRNRFVRTAGLLAELEAERALFAGILEQPELSEREGWGSRRNMKDASSTDVIVHNGVALSTFYQCGDAYQCDPITLAPRGIAALGHERFGRGTTISAHPKVDERTGELLFFNYSTHAPYCHVGVADAEGVLQRAIPVELPGARLPHDIAFTERFVVVNDFPLFWDEARLEKNVYRPVYRPELGSRFGLVPRDGKGEVRWFTADPTYVLHFTNAWEEGNEVVLEGYFQGSPMPQRTADDTAISMFMKSLDMHSMQTRRHRWRFDLATGLTREERVDEIVSEFPTIHAGFAGRKHRYVYAAIGEPGRFLFNGFLRTDTETGAQQTLRLPSGVFASEAPFCPRVGATSEDDGYLVTFTIDMNENRSECLVLDARAIDRAPVARIRLPMRISSGTHATWAPRTSLRA